MQETWFTVQEVAANLKVSPRTVRRLIVAGELKPIRVGQQLRINATELARYTEAAAR